MTPWWLLADVGGTNARFARCDDARKMYARVDFRVIDFPTFQAALQRFVETSGGPEGCAGAAIAAAGPLEDGRVALTNADWVLSKEDVTGVLGDVRVQFANDLEAVANVLPSVPPSKVQPVGDILTPASGSSRLLVVNVGTGFGAASAVRHGPRWTVNPSEAGHMSFGAENADELALLGAGSSDAVSVEDILSGSGVVRLYMRICEQNSEAPEADTPARIFELAAGQRACAEQTVAIFTGWLARAARNLVFATAAWDGVFLCGGVVHGWSNVASPSLFRRHFSKTGKLRSRLQATFTGIILDPDAALAGLALRFVTAPDYPVSDGV